MPDYDKADPLLIARSHEKAARRLLRYEQLREELAQYAADVRAGRFRNPPPPPVKPLPWDGVKNSQITPIGG